MFLLMGIFRKIKFVLNAVLIIFIAFVIYNYTFRLTSEDLFAILKTQIHEQMDADKMQIFLNKYEFECERLKDQSRLCDRNSKTLDLMGAYKHSIAFKIENNKIVNLQTKYFFYGFH